jgi:hypothetical protein
VFEGSIWIFAAASTAAATCERGSSLPDEPAVDVVVDESAAAVVDGVVTTLDPQPVTRRANATIRTRPMGGAFARRSNCLPAPVL